MSISSRNIPLWMLRAFFYNLPLFFSIWYVYETQFTSIATLGIIYGVSNLCTILMEVPTGYLADRWGRRQASMIGYFLMGVSWFVVGTATGAWSLWVGYLVNGIGAAFVSGATTALDYDTLKQDGREAEFSLWMSRANIIANIAVFFAIIGGGYLGTYSLRWTYLGTGIFQWVVVVTLLFGIEPNIGGKITTPIQKTLEDFWQTIRAIYIDTSTRFLMLYYMLMGGISYAFIFVFALVYASSIYHETISRGYVLATITLVVALFMAGIAKKIVRHPQFALVVWGIVASVGYLGVGLVSVAWLAPVWMFLLYLAFNIRIAVVDQFVNDIFPSKFRATLLSVLNLGASIIVLLALAFGGRGVELFGVTKVFLVIGVVALLATLAFANRRLWKSAT